MLLGLVAIITGVGPGGPIVVDPAGPVQTLTAALRLAHDGDHIVVHTGEYHEGTIRIVRPVSIEGEGLPVFDAGGEEAFRITADSVTIRGLVIRNVAPFATEDRAGIKVVDAHGCVIEHNRLEATFFGIYLSRVTGCSVRWNNLVATGRTDAMSGNGIHSWSSSNLVIEHNTVSGHRDGIYFEFTTHARVRNNTGSHNLRYGLHFMFSNGCDYSDNHFVENGAGVAVMYSRDVTMRDNWFERNWGGAAYGLLLKEITDSRLERNHFVANSTGLFAEGTNRVVVTGNDFERNGWAVRVMGDAQETTFQANRFAGNSFDVATNSVNASSRFEGNYWDRYAGYDLDHDGYGDVAFAPVTLFSLVVERRAPALILLHSFFTDLLDLAERALPVLTPMAMADPKPMMRWQP